MSECCCGLRRHVVVLRWLLILLLLLLLLPSHVSKDIKGGCNHNRTIQDSFYHPGDAVIGGIFSLTFPKFIWQNFKNPPEKYHRTFR